MCSPSSSAASWSRSPARARSSTSITAPCSTRSSGRRSRSCCARGSRKTSPPTPRKYAFLGSLAPLGEPQPALDDAVDDPDRVGHQDDPADDDDEQDAADHAPQQSPPECADLPAEMRFEPGAGGVVALHVVDDRRDDPGDAEEEARRLQRVDRSSDVPQFRFAVHCAPSITTRLRRDFRPAAMRTLRFGTPKYAARNSISAAFALPSTGGAASRPFTRPPCSPPATDPAGPA